MCILDGELDFDQQIFVFFKKKKLCLKLCATMTC